MFIAKSGKSAVLDSRGTPQVVWIVTGGSIPVSIHLIFKDSDWWLPLIGFTSEKTKEHPIARKSEVVDNLKKLKD